MFEYFLQCLSSVCKHIWSRELVNLNHKRTQKKKGLTFVTRVHGTWTMCAQWAGKLMTASIWRLYTCSVKVVQLLLGTVEQWWLKQKRTKQSDSTAATFTIDMFDSCTTSTHFTVLWACPEKDILAPLLVASQFFCSANRISEGLDMWGEQIQQSQWHVAFFFTWRGSECVCMCAGDRYHLSPSDTQNAHLQKCGWHLQET